MNLRRNTMLLGALAAISWIAGCEPKSSAPVATTDTTTTTETPGGQTTLETAGTETAGTETAGTETTGTETAGTETTGTETTGTETTGTETTSGGSCLNAADLKIIAEGKVPGIAQQAGYSCLAAADKATCAQEKVVKDTGLTSACAGCYSGQVVCVLNSPEAIQLCVSDPQDFPCSNWRKANCPDFYACSGLENCVGGEDEDGDGATDCADSECSAAEVCNCADAADNDADKHIDCDDPSCCGVTGCSNPKCE
jgi:hypothetical protein